MEPIWILHTAVDNFWSCTVPDPRIRFSVVDRSDTLQRLYTCAVHGKRVDVVSNAYSLIENPTVLAGNNNWAHRVIFIIGSLITSISRAEYERFIIALALLLTAGRTEGLSIVKVSENASQDNGKTLNQHLEEFAAFVLDLRELASELPDCEAKDGFFKITKFLQEKPQTRLTDAKNGPFAQRCKGAIQGKAIFQTESGKVGLAPVGYFGTRTGDQIMVLRGGRVPFMLRPVRRTSKAWGTGTHRFIGECYMHGAMNKEHDKQVIGSSEEFVLV